MTNTTVKSEEVQASWGDLLDSVLQGNEVVIERSSTPVAVVVNPTEWHKLKQFHADELRRRSAEMDTEPEAAVPWEQVKQEMANRGLIDAPTLDNQRQS